MSKDEVDEILKDFDEEFDKMSDAEILYAEALAHLLDVDSADYIEFLEDEDGEEAKNAAESQGSYGEE